MIKPTIIPTIMILFLAMIFMPATPASAQTRYERSARYLSEVAEEYYLQGDYQQALHEFKKALMIDPDNEQIKDYIELIEQELAALGQESREMAIAEAMGHLERSAEPDIEKELVIEAEFDLEDELPGPKQEVSTEFELEAFAEEVLVIERDPEAEEERRRIRLEQAEILFLDEELWQSQPKTTLEIEYQKSLILEGNAIARYLVDKPDKIEIERVDSDQIVLAAENIGTTFVHVWDEQGRWTFSVRVVSPYVPAPKKEILVYGEDPFKIAYRADWQNYYKVDEDENFERRTLIFNQWVGIYGPTPYGDFDASAEFNRYAKEHELGKYTVGLTDGDFGWFKNFHLRGFDFNESFSDLSYPGELLQGIYFQSDAFDENIQYTVLSGQEREGFGYIIPGVLQERDIFITAGRLTLFPYKDQTFSFNYAKGTGPDRPDYLREEVYSLDGTWELEDKNFSWEIGYDGYNFATLLNSEFNFYDLDLFINLRNISKDYTSVSSRPTGRGEIGSEIRANWRATEDLDIYSSLDIYRAGYNYNEGNPDQLNFDWDADFSLELGQDSYLNTSVSYANEPGLSFPRRYLNIRSTYSTLWQIHGQEIAPYWGMGFAKSRNSLSSTSDYDVYRALAGLRIPITDGLFYRMNYEYDWVKEDASGEKDNPSFIESGLDYHLAVSPFANADMRLFYRNEQNTGLIHSFLSGEDSLEGSVRINLVPADNIEFFAEARARQVWTDPHDSDDYLEAEFLMGLETEWDTFFTWNPKGEISGFVFEDVNGNGERDAEDLPLESVFILAGTKYIITNEEGYFCSQVRGKKIVVQLDETSLPEGYILTTPNSQEVEIGPEPVIVNFGASSFAIIYGVVFDDANSNGRFDPQEEVIPNVKLYLDTQATLTNFEGSYYFKQLQEGNYLLKLDINSLPIKFIPTVPIEKQINLLEGVNYNYNIPCKRK